MKCFSGIIIVLSTILASTLAIDYCSKDICINQNHIACGNNGDFGLKCPAERSVVPMTADLIDLILTKHNTARVLFAYVGMIGFEKADRMIEMSWDNELAKFAEMNAKTCVFSHDSCRNTAVFKYAGQNIGMTSSSSNYKNGTSAFSEVFDLWFIEYVDCNKTQISKLTGITATNGKSFGHFTQIVMANSTKIGCAIVNYFANSLKNTLVVCDYSQTNVIGWPVYTSGTPGSGCTSGFSSKHAKLCSPNELDVVVEASEPEVPTSDYCSKDICINQNHIACGNNGDFGLKCPAERSVVPMTADLIDLILTKHNTARVLFAYVGMTGFEKANRMIEMSWDNELAKFAEMNAKTCVFAHDSCRNTAVFKYAGQNIGMTSSSSNYKNGTSAFSEVFDLWFMEYVDCNKTQISKLTGITATNGKSFGHFTQIVMANSTKIGCAIVNYFANSLKNTLVVCDYSQTNVIGWPVYTSGTPGSGCTSGFSSKHAKLCSPNELDVVVEASEPEVPTSDYCSKDICINQNHIACGNNGDFGLKCPAERSVVPMTADLIDLILTKHNTARVLFAYVGMTGFEKANRMIEMSWDNELAKFAEMNAKTCVFAHDSCRNTAVFKYAGQNIGMTSSSSNYKNGTSAFSEVFDLWFIEYVDCNKTQISKLTGITATNGKSFGHFTQIVMANSTKIGCAIVNYFANSMKNTLVVCDYSQTNVIGWPVYTSGTPGSGCTSGFSSKHAKLCSPNELDVVVEASEPEVPTSDYCSKDICINQNHIACGNNGDFGLKCPAERSVVPMTADLIDLILTKHNTARVLFAYVGMTGFEKANRMIEMSWDNELAKFAEMNAKTCVFAHDSCRNTAVFKYAGQNIGMTSSSSNYKNGTSAFSEVFDLWFMEYVDCNKTQISKLTGITATNGKSFGHFTQIVMANSTKIGCAIVNYFANSLKNTLVVCDYSQTNVIGWPVYTSGTPGSGCTSGLSSKHAKLCSPNEVV